MTSTPAREEEEEARKQFENIFWRETVFSISKARKREREKGGYYFLPEFSFEKAGSAARKEANPGTGTNARAHTLYYFSRLFSL